MARYLVTGGAGFIGSHLVEALVTRGESVVALDNLSSGSLANLAPWRDRIEFLEADVRDPAAMRRACAGVDYVLHHAALASVPASLADPVASNEANVSGTLTALLAAREAGVRRFVYAGSSSAYGDEPTLPKREEMPAAPLSPYAIAKYAGELYTLAFSWLYGLETVVLRYFNIFGPRQDPNSQYAAVIPRFIWALQQNRRPVVFGDGEQSRDFTYVADVVEANLLAGQAPGAVGQVINIARGEQTSLNQLLALLHGVTGLPLAAEYTDPKPGDVRHSVADIGRARELLGYQPRVPLEEGLRRTAEWFARPG